MATNKITLVLYPNAFGMGYLLCETPQEIIDYGVARIRPLSRNAYLKRLLKFLKEYKPALVIIRDYEEGDKRISPRVKKIISAFRKEAEKINVETYTYTRKQIQDIFEQFGTVTKYGIAKKLSDWYPELATRLPKPRKITQAEHYQMGIFDTFSLLLTHYYLLQ